MNLISIIKNNIKPYHFCCISLLNCLYPLYIFYKKPVKNILEKGCAGFNIAIIICGELFWINPVRKGIYHQIDSIVVKSAVSYYIFYIFLNKSNSIKKIIEYISFSFLLGTSFYFSNYYSSIEWCSSKHIILHSIFHLVCSRGMLLAF
jgi:hypothetical protein